MVFELHTLDASDTGALLGVVLRELDVLHSDTIKVVQEPFTGLQTPEWTKHQPFQRMPYMVDTEANFELYEVRTICKYIATELGSVLMPKPEDSVEFWAFDRAMTTETTQFFPFAGGICLEACYAQAFYHREPNASIIDWCHHELKRCFEGYERVLANQEYLGGDELSLVDLVHPILILMIQSAGYASFIHDGTLPNVQRWWGKLKSRPSVREAWNAKSEAIKAMMGP